MDKIINNTLPHGWSTLNFNDTVCMISLNNKKIKEKEYKISGKFPVIDQGKKFIGGYYDDEDMVVEERPPYILFGDHTKVKKYIDFKFIAGGDGAKVFKVKKFIDSQFLYYFSNAVILPDKGYARHFQYLKKTQIPIPPMNEQRRIVNKIQELFSEIDKGLENLEVIKKQLGAYRQAVLTHSYLGEFTNIWREKNKNKIDTNQLIELINIDRETYYKQSKRKVKSTVFLSVEEIKELPSLPENWSWVKLAQIAEVIGGITKGKDFKGKETISLPYLRVANVQNGYLDLSEIKEISLLETEKDKYMLRENDILYTEGGDKDKLGRGTIWQNEIENCVHQNHIFRARLYSTTVNPKYIAYYSQTFTARKYFFHKAKQTVNLASINLTVLSNLAIPLPSVEEQNKIVEEIESRLSQCENIQNVIGESVRKAEALRQSILKKAFEGKIVLQDSNDEPAEKLIERINQNKL